jgi:hypothetical protein
MLSPEDRSRMVSYLRELRDLFNKHPDSLPLRNGIIALEDRLGLRRSFSQVDLIEFIDTLQKIHDT